MHVKYLYYLLILILVNNNNVLSYTSNRITLFQVIDQSHIPLWINFWLVSLELDVFPKEWDYYLACFGDIDHIIKKYHTPGCSKTYITNLHISHIYYAKWLSIYDAFTTTKHNLLCIDIDTVMIRNPSSILNDINSDLYDIVSSRDHGPGNLEYSMNWGSARLCTGFLFLRHSKYTEEIVFNVLQRCKKYGHDQIQFNKLLSRSSLIWNDPPSVMNNDTIDHDGYIYWFSQDDNNFIVIDDPDLLYDWKTQNDTINYMISNNKNILKNYNTTITNKILNQTSMNPYTFQSMVRIKILNKYKVLRYCSNVQSKGRNWIYNLKINENLHKIYPKDITVLHCFTYNGNIDEQGNEKGHTKLMVLEALNLLVLKNSYKTITNTTHALSSSLLFNGSNFLLPKSNKTKTFIQQMINNKSLHDLKNIWLHERYESHKTLFELNPKITKKKKITKKNKKTNGYRKKINNNNS